MYSFLRRKKIMADRIFPNRFQEDPLDSDLVFQGIDWDNFNQRLAEAKDDKGNKVPVPLMKALHDANEEAFDSIAKHGKDTDRKSGSMYAEDNDEDAEASMEHKSGYMKEAKKGIPDGLREWMEQNGKGKGNSKKKAESDDDEDHDDEEHDEDHDEVDSKEDMKRKGPKAKTDRKASVHFTHPSQLSAEAVEAAIASGDQELANTILAARHQRRVRLASQIQTRVAADNEKNVRLAQRRAYREALVQNVENNNVRTASSASNDFAPINRLATASKRAFASKAAELGFPQEYVQAMLGTTKVSDNLSKIKKVLSSDLESNVKIAAASSMVKTATLSDSDYSRLVDYWKNELGYGDQEWIDALFTKKYDK
jgi:hypothetical protein